MRKRVKLFIEESWLLIIASILFGALLALTNAAWAPRIAQNEVDRFNLIAGSLLEGVEFQTLEEAIEITAPNGRPISVEVKRGRDKNGQTAGWAFVVVGSGFADKIRLVAVLDATFSTLAGFGVLSSNETPGFGDKINLTGPGTFQSQFQGAPAGAFRLTKVGDADRIDQEIVAMTGATVTSQAVVDAMNFYLGAVKEAMQAKGLIQ